MLIFVRKKLNITIKKLNIDPFLGKTLCCLCTIIKESYLLTNALKVIIKFYKKK
jgi:hypothetical protein